MLILGCGNVSGFSDRWDFAFENRALSLLMQIRRRKPLLKKLRRLARDESVELWSVTRLIYTWHLDRSEHSFPRETSAFLHTYTCHKALHLAVYSFDSDEFLLG
jgi:hypothetical protein